MKKYTKLYFLLIVAGMICTLQVSAAVSSEVVQWEQFEKVIKQSFEFNTNAPSFSVENSYGDISIVSSNRNSASVEVTITVDAKSQSRANDIFDRIQIEFDQSDNNASAKTKFSGNGKKTKKGESYTIDYKIFLPERSNLDVKNKYGDISLSEHQNDVKVELKYGSGSFQGIAGDLEMDLKYVNRFKVGDVKGDLDLDMAYSHLKVNEAQELDCVLSYSDFTIERASNVEMESKYNSASLGQVDALLLNDKYSGIDIDEAVEIDLEMKYSDIKVGKLSKIGSFDTSYGSVGLKKVETTVESIEIDAGHTSYRIGYQGGMSLDIETKYTNVDYPNNLKIQYREKEDNELNLKGTIEGVGILKILATMKYGSLKIID